MLFDKPNNNKGNDYPWTEAFKKAMHQNPWTVDDFNFQSDIQDFKVTLTELEQDVIVRGLTAISQVEEEVKQFWGRLGEHFPHKSLINLGYVMANTEVIHNDAYERLLQVLDIEDKVEEYKAAPAIANRVKYLGKRNHRYYKDSKQHYIHAMILFTLLVENVSLFSQFYLVLWFGRFKGVLKDTNQQVLYTKNEELIHGQIGTKIINVLRKEYPELFDEELEKLIQEEIADSFAGEVELIKWFLGDYTNERLTVPILTEFVKSRYNDTMTDIGYKAPFELDPTLEREYDWAIEEILGSNKVDFFHQRSVDYARSAKVYSIESLWAPIDKE